MDHFAMLIPHKQLVETFLERLVSSTYGELVDSL